MYLFLIIIHFVAFLEYLLCGVIITTSSHMENITCSNECGPYFLESRITFRFTKGDLLCSSIHDIPIVWIMFFAHYQISHVRYDSPADHLNITSGSIIYKINDSEEDFHCADCDTLFPTSSESVTISLRRLIPYVLLLVM